MISKEAAWTHIEIKLSEPAKHGCRQITIERGQKIAWNTFLLLLLLLLRCRMETSAIEEYSTVCANVGQTCVKKTNPKKLKMQLYVLTDLLKTG